MRHIIWLLLQMLGMLFWLNTLHAQSPREQLTQMVEQLKRDPSDNAFRERIIKLAQEIKPPPAVPEEAERRIVRGTAAFKGAKSTSDYQDAAREFEQAALAAPWYADAYYNLATARSKAEDYAGAVWSLKFYLLASPDAKDAKEAKALMYEMEYKQERANKDKAEAEAMAAKKAQGQRLLESFRGTWYGRNCYVGEFGGESHLRGGARRVRYKVVIGTHSGWTGALFP